MGWIITPSFREGLPAEVASLTVPPWVTFVDPWLVEATTTGQAGAGGSWVSVKNLP